MDWHYVLEHGKENCLRESKMGVYLPGMGIKFCMVLLCIKKLPSGL